MDAKTAAHCAVLTPVCSCGKMPQERRRVMAAADCSRLARMKTIWMLMALLAAAPPARATETKPTVAILYFDYSGKDEQLGVLRKGLAQMLISDLSSQEAVRIVERDRLEEILKELKL